MGVFFDTQGLDREKVKQEIKDALEKSPGDVPDKEKEAEEKTNKIEIAPPGYPKFNAGRFFGAVVIWALIVAAAITTDAVGGMDDSTTALWALAGTIFGVVVGFLGGEKTAAT
jgi:hypothetical protein